MQKTAQQTIENPCTSAAASSAQTQYEFHCDTEMKSHSSTGLIFFGKTDHRIERHMKTWLWLVTDNLSLTKQQLPLLLPLSKIMDS